MVSLFCIRRPAFIVGVIVLCIEILFAQALSARAAERKIFVCTDPAGHREYSEKDLGNCKEVELPTAGPSRDRPVGKGGVRLGMTVKQVRMSSWGEPNHVNRTINAAGVTEQWVYDGSYLYFTNGILTTIQN